MKAICGGTVYTMAGPPIPDGRILIDQGKIAAVGGKELEIPQGVQVIEAPGCWITQPFGSVGRTRTSGNSR